MWLGKNRVLQEYRFFGSEDVVISSVFVPRKIVVGPTVSGSANQTVVKDPCAHRLGVHLWGAPSVASFLVSVNMFKPWTTGRLQRFAKESKMVEDLPTRRRCGK